MYKKQDFTEQVQEHGNMYSSYLLTKTNIDAVLDVLNSNLKGLDKNMAWPCSAREEDGNVYFEIFKADPELIYEMTERLNTVGYADTDWDETYTVCAKNGMSHDGYSAAFLEVVLCDKDHYDVRVLITDEESGAEFQTGGGYVDLGVLDFYEDLVLDHPRKADLGKFIREACPDKVSEDGTFTEEMTFDIGFIDPRGKSFGFDIANDETEFTAESIEDLEELYRDFCKENRFPVCTVKYVVPVVERR